VKFDFYPPECNLKAWEEADQTRIKALFDQQCKGKQSCTFKFRQLDLPDTYCILPQSTAANWQFVILSSCSASSVSLGFDNLKASKSVIGIVVVIFDLVITFIFWCSMLALKKIQQVEQSEI